MKKLRSIVEVSVVATTAMTAFSYGLSGLCKQNYREPELLAGTVFRRVHNQSIRRPLGWLTHYAVGILWAAAYRNIFKAPTPCRSMRKAVAFGTISGTISAAVWFSVLERRCSIIGRPKGSFLIQLVPGHIVFGFALNLADFFRNEWQRESDSVRVHPSRPDQFLTDAME